jgi:hypothetical protein
MTLRKGTVDKTEYLQYNFIMDKMKRMNQYIKKEEGVVYEKHEN